MYMYMYVYAYIYIFFNLYLYICGKLSGLNKLRNLKAIYTLMTARLWRLYLRMELCSILRTCLFILLCGNNLLRDQHFVLESSSSGSLSGEEIAGIVIACVVAAALVAIMAWAIRRRCAASQSYSSKKAGSTWFQFLTTLTRTDRGEVLFVIARYAL